MACFNYENWDAVYEDRIIKLVFIGIDFDKAGLIASLEACLLKEAELKENWKVFIDELPNQKEEIETR